MSKLALTRKKAIKLLVQLGFKAAGNLDDKQLTKRLQDVPSLMEGVRLDTFTMKKTLNKVTRADSIRIKSAKEIEKESNQESSTVAKKKKKKDSTKKGGKKKGGKKKAKAEEPTKKKKKKDSKKKSGKKKAASTKKESRLSIAVKLILKAKKGTSLEEIANKVEMAFVENGGSESPRASSATVRVALEALEVSDQVTAEKFTK
jgi:hypothetical protein